MSNGRADDGDVVLADVADVLAVGRLEERVDPGERGLLAAREQRDRAVLNRGRRLEPQVEPALELLARAPVGYVREPA